MQASNIKDQAVVAVEGGKSRRREEGRFVRWWKDREANRTIIDKH